MSEAPRTRPPARRVVSKENLDPIQEGEIAARPGNKPTEETGYEETGYSEPPPRRTPAQRPRPQYYDEPPPRRDRFPIMMGGIIGALVVGIVLVLLLLLSRNSGVVSNLPSSAPTVASSNAPTAVTSSSSNRAGETPTMAARSSDSTSQPVASGPGTVIPEEGKDHTDEGATITYKSYPPSSGSHYPSTADYGFSDKEIAEGKLVHSLEHGSIVVYYKPSLDADTMQKLRDLYSSTPPAKYGKAKLIIVPYSNPKMEAPIVIAAWTHIVKFSSFDKDGLLRFYQAWVDKGPEDVP